DLIELSNYLLGYQIHRLTGMMRIDKVTHLHPGPDEGVVDLNLVVNCSLLEADLHAHHMNGESTKGTEKKQQDFIHVLRRPAFACASRRSADPSVQVELLCGRGAL